MKTGLPGDMKIVLLCALISLTAIPGCISMKSYPLGIVQSANETGSREYEILGEAEGTSSRLRLFWVFPVTPDMNYSEAVNETVRTRGGDNLIDVTSWKDRDIYIVGTVEVLHVKGKVIRYLR